jgi:hypothetical protein
MLAGHPRVGAAVPSATLPLVAALPLVAVPRLATLPRLALSFAALQFVVPG